MEGDRESWRASPELSPLEASEGASATAWQLRIIGEEATAREDSSPNSRRWSSIPRGPLEKERKSR